MPNRAPRSCPRCRRLITGRRCPDCAARALAVLSLRTAPRTPQPGSNPYATPQWTAFSRTFRRLHPTCECERCMRLPEYARPRSQVVDHIDGLGPAGPRGYDPTNMRAMTRGHHSAKTNRHDGGLGHTINRMTS